MDFKDFHDGLLSLSLVLLIFSFTFLMGTIMLRPLINLHTNDMYFIVILCLVNMGFSLYYLSEALRLKKIYKMADRHIIKFAKRIGIVTIIYSPHFFLHVSLLFRGFNSLQVMMAGLIFFMELCLLGLLFKEVTDILFMTEEERKFELDANRKRYLEGSKAPLMIDDKEPEYY